MDTFQVGSGTIGVILCGGFALGMLVMAWAQRSLTAGNLKRLNENLKSLPPLPRSPEEGLTDMAVMAMLTAYRNIEHGNAAAAKLDLATFMASWCGLRAQQQQIGQKSPDPLPLVRAESAPFPQLAALIEKQIAESKSKPLEQWLAEEGRDLANSTLRVGAERK